MSTAKVYNMGGPQRMSRVDMAETVAAVCGLSHEAIVPAPAASVNRGVASPADISMNSGLLKVQALLSYHWMIYSLAFPVSAMARDHQPRLPA